MMQKPGTSTKYIYAVARVRVLETRLLGSSSFERLLEEETPQDFIRVLGTFQDYAEVTGLLNEEFDFEDLLAAVLDDTYNLVRQLLADKSLIEPFFLKSKILKASDGLAGPLADSALYGLFFDAWKQNIFLNEYIKTAIDLENMKIFLRLKSIEWPREILEKALLANGRIPANYFKNSLAATTAEFFRTFEYHRYDRLIRDGLGEYEDGASLARFEKLCDDMLIAYLRQAKYFAFGSEPLIAYALAREFETKNLRAIFVGKSNNFKEAEIRELLRESYV